MASAAKSQILHSGEDATGTQAPMNVCNGAVEFTRYPGQEPSAKSRIMLAKGRELFH
jgi:hypothetical protein